MKTDHSTHPIPEVDANAFQSAIQKGIVVVGFGDPWSGPCRAESSMLEHLAAHVGPDVSVAEVNVDDAQDLAASLHIEVIPTVLLFKAGQLRQRFVGVLRESRVSEAIEAARAG